jgi:transcriptional regulator with XRE-family HTH domain
MKMKKLTNEQTEFAVATLQKWMDSRGFSQTDLEQVSGVNQSTISKILNRSLAPSADVLKKLFQGMGHKLSDILHETDALGHEILGYLATPLTAVVKDERSDRELTRIVSTLKEIASSAEFADPPFVLYWPGDYTHPVKNPEFPARRVYLTDRSRASTHDFIVMFCASPSYGVGQENEIATQAGLPAIRLVPDSISRMMSGSFIKTTDITFSGSLNEGIAFNHDDFRKALREIRQKYFRFRALFKGINGADFGDRLRRLIDKRSANYETFADDIGVSLSYVHALMDEHPSVTNPSLRLLKKIATVLGESVAYLIGESEEADPIWTESKATWHTWATTTSGLDAALALRIKDNWCDQYRARKSQPAMASFRRNLHALSKGDWDSRYREEAAKTDVRNRELFRKSTV